MALSGSPITVQRSFTVQIVDAVNIISIISPESGARLNSNRPIRIMWSSRQGSFRLSYSLDNFTFTPIAEVSNVNFYDWAPAAWMRAATLTLRVTRL